jgi:hypothetical protein
MNRYVLTMTHHHHNNAAYPRTHHNQSHPQNNLPCSIRHHPSFSFSFSFFVILLAREQPNLTATQITNNKGDIFTPGFWVSAFEATRKRLHQADSRVGDFGEGEVFCWGGKAKWVVSRDGTEWKKGRDKAGIKTHDPDKLSAPH